MKKGLIVAIALLLAISLVGCTTNAPTAEESTAPAQTEETVQDETKEEAAAAPNETETEEMAAEGQWPVYGEKIYLGVAIRSLSNPYQAKVKEGAEALAAELNALGYDIEVNVMTCEGSDEKQINDIKSLIARGGNNTVLYVDPNNSPNAAVIADICEQAQVYWASVWNIPENTYPMDYKYWVCHNSPDDVQAGYDIAVDMFNSFETPGKGKILQLQGMLGNSASSNRDAGLEKALAEYPDIELLDTQPTDWDMTKSLDITQTWLSKYKDIDGIWTSGDPMGLGACTALKNAGYEAGEVKTTGVNGTQEAIDSILAGELTNTWDVGGYTQGYYVSAWVLAAKLGVIDVENAPVSDRMFLTPGQLINSENVDKAGEAPACSYLDFESFNIGAMPNDWEG